MIFRKNHSQQKSKVRIVLAEIDKLMICYPNGDFSDQSCIAKITEVKVQDTFVRICLEIVPLRGCMAQVVMFRPVLYITQRYPIKNITVFNQEWVYHPNVDIYTKKYAIPNEHTLDRMGCMPNSIEYTIKYLKFICIEPCMCYIPYNLANMEAAIRFQRLKGIPKAYIQLMKKEIGKTEEGIDQDIETDTEALCDMSKTINPSQERPKDLSLLLVTEEMNQLKLKLN